jgi:hypothetical protein
MVAKPDWVKRALDRATFYQGWCVLASMGLDTRGELHRFAPLPRDDP